MAATWAPGTPGVLVLPSGRTVRGTALDLSGSGAEQPDFALHLAAEEPAPRDWPTRWVHWRDFRTPSDPEDAREALREAWERSSRQRVEVACRGGRGRTGTALACLAVIDGVPPSTAVAFVRRGFHPRAVETPWQKRFVRRFGKPPTSG